MLSKPAAEEARKELLDMMLDRPSVGRGIGSCGSSGDDGASNGTRKLIMELGESMKSDYSNISTQLHAMKESQEEMKGEVKSVKKSQEEMKGEVHSLEGRLDAMKNSLEEVKGEVKSVKNSQQEMKDGLDVVKNSLEEMKSGLDAVRKSLEGVKCVATTTQPENVSNSDEGEVIPQILDAKELRDNCIEGMMVKTTVNPSNEGNNSKMRKLYEKMYDEDSILSTVLQFIRFNSSVEVHVDFESTTIGGMKPRLRDHDGREWSGGEFVEFADFEERKAYVGGNWDGDVDIIAFIAIALSQLCVLLAFGNRGLPYSKDGERERELYEGILEEAERKREELDWRIRTYALVNRTTHIGKGIYLHAAVPSMIARYGSSDGRTKLNDQLPSLLDYIEKHVMTALRGEETMKRIAAEMVTRL